MEAMTEQSRTSPEGAWLEWREEFDLGIPLIDFQHRKLLGVIGRIHDVALKAACLQDCLEADIHGLLYDLSVYARVHFSDEEEEFAKLGRPLDSGHLAGHDAFLEKIADGSMRLIEGRTPDMLSCAEFLKIWWLGHVLDEDRKAAGKA